MLNIKFSLNKGSCGYKENHPSSFIRPKKYIITRRSLIKTTFSDPRRRIRSYSDFTDLLREFCKKPFLRKNTTYLIDMKLKRRRKHEHKTKRRQLPVQYFV